MQGERVNVTEAEWQLHGHVRFFTPDEMPDPRAVAARTLVS